MRLAIDSSACLEICLSVRGFDLVSEHEFVAPALIRSEVLSALRALDWRKAIPAELVQRVRGRLPTMPIEIDRARDHLDRAWAIASDLGWAKTYDAEYLAVAIHRDVPLLTIDGRLQRGAAGIARVITPTEL